MHTIVLLKRCWRDWVVHRWRQLILAFVLMAAVAATTGAYPLIISQSFDMLSAGDLGVLPIVLVVIICATALRALFLYLQTVVTNKIVMRLAVDIQRDVFSHLIRSDFARLTRDTPGHLVSRLTNDVNYVQVASLGVLNTAIRDILTVIALVGSMFYLDWVMSLIVLGVYPLAAIPIANIGHRLRRVAKNTQLQLGDMTAQLTESLSGARLIKTYSLESYAVDRLNSRFEDIFKLRMKAVRSKAQLDPMLELLGGIAVAGVVALASYRIASGIQTVGDFTGFVTALLMAAQPIRALGNLNAKLQEGLAAAQRVFELLDEEPSIVDTPQAYPLKVSKGSLEFETVAFTYDGNEEPAVRDFTLVVPGGCTVALVGRSGAGKSTIINLVPRLFDVSAGQIAIDGQNICDVKVATLRDAISIVSQDITLFNDTLHANIALGQLGAARNSIVQAAKAARADEFIEQLPEGYDTIIGDRGMRLSGGQRQRIALARAILKDAPILLLDEATSALDTHSEWLVQQALARFSQNRTTLVIAHRLSTVQNADLICVMDAGTIVERGTHTELRAKSGLYEQMILSQLQPSVLKEQKAEAAQIGVAE